MKMEIIKIGKCRHPAITELSQEYLKRLQPFIGIDSSIWKEGDNEAKLSRLFQSDSVVICLDERGKEWSSVELSTQIRSWSEDPSLKKVYFVIGGPYGHSSAFKNKANHLWSLSKSTFPSDFSWLIVCEQIYRAFTILKGMSYHHE
jgi:23S rRNA (pseudouridine1915-N3)-methyltransferase